VFLDFADAIRRLGESTIRERYGNLFEMYEHITSENPYKVPMRIYPAVHYCMGGLWVDYKLMSNIPGLFVLGEANFSDHGANRLGASALMQGLADGYFVAPYTITDYLAGVKPGSSTDLPEFAEAEARVAATMNRLQGTGGKTSAQVFHRELGKMVWDHCGMARNRAGLEKLLRFISEIRDRFWKDVSVPATAGGMNQGLQYAGRVADFIDFAEVLATDALTREESCGAHFREEYQTDDGEAARNDAEYSFVSAWEHKGEGKAPALHREALNYEFVKPSVRSYK
jgi:succinate dehydrogenase / fumarate reductase, flavoprotein subunit